MAVSCTVFEIKRDIGRKTVMFHTNLIFNLHDPIETLRVFLPKIVMQNVRLSRLLEGAEILPKS